MQEKHIFFNSLQQCFSKWGLLGGRQKAERKLKLKIEKNNVLIQSVFHSLF